MNTSENNWAEILASTYQTSKEQTCYKSNSICTRNTIPSFSQYIFHTLNKLYEMFKKYLNIL